MTGKGLRQIGGNISPYHGGNVDTSNAAFAAHRHGLYSAISAIEEIQIDRRRRIQLREVGLQSDPLVAIGSILYGKVRPASRCINHGTRLKSPEGVETSKGPSPSMR